jgi:hypothetical protein
MRDALIFMHTERSLKFARKGIRVFSQMMSGSLPYFRKSQLKICSLRESVFHLLNRLTIARLARRFSRSRSS